MIEKPVLSAKDMAEFISNYSLEYRRKCLAYFEEIHEASYVAEVKKYLVEIFKKSKKQDK